MAVEVIISNKVPLSSSDSLGTFLLAALDAEESIDWACEERTGETAYKDTVIARKDVLPYLEQLAELGVWEIDSIKELN